MSGLAVPEGARARLIGLRLERFALGGAVVGLTILAAILSPAFLTAGNIRDILTQAAPLGMVVLAQALIMLVRGIDLSVASVMASAAVLATAFTTTNNADIPMIFGAVLLGGAVIGGINGWLVTRRNVSPFLATLAMMILLQGVRFAYTQGAPSGLLPSGFRWLGTGQISGVPVNLAVLILLALGLGVMLRFTVLGRAIYIIGGNPRAAELVGLSAQRITLLCYCLGSMLAGIAGLFLVGFVGTVDNWVGRGYELDSIVAAVIGGVSLAGGSGSVTGALLGVLILVLLSNLVVILGLPVEFQLILKGIIIILATGLYARRTRI